MEVIIKLLRNDRKELELSDMTVGKKYAAYLPQEGEEDKDGLRRHWDDEVWIYRDDAGDGVVSRLCYGFEVVSEI